jgi:hypothetical protein
VHPAETKIQEQPLRALSDPSNQPCLELTVGSPGRELSPETGLHLQRWLALPEGADRKEAVFQEALLEL